MIKEEFSKVHQIVMTYWAINFRANATFSIHYESLERSRISSFYVGKKKYDFFKHAAQCASYRDIRLMRAKNLFEIIATSFQSPGRGISTGDQNHILIPHT